MTTDGFLYPNAELQARGLMERKGFPESYDTRALIEFLRNVKSGATASAPVYDHITYDIVSDERVVVDSPDIVIVEGINVLQVGGDESEFVSDYFDFSIYVDADELHIQEWYIERFLAFRESYSSVTTAFPHYAHLSDDEAAEMAKSIWQRINGVNLSENIMPTRNRASLVVRKGRDHRI